MASDVVTDELFHAFSEALRGRVLRPGDTGYEEARVVWNAMIDRRPAMIAQCAGAADVIAAVRFAQANSIALSVRAGGHSVAGHGVVDGGLMIDLSRMKGIRVDPGPRVVRAEAGVTWGEFDRETQAFGLATTGGVVSTTGIAGLTLGGGLGYLMRRFGLACDNLISADIVTANGRLLTASQDQNADLFWGLRGGGGNFGIVTSLEYQLHEVGPIVLAGLVVHPASAARDALRFYRDFASAAPDDLTTHFAFATGPDGRRCVLFATCYSGPLERGHAVVRPLREFGSPVEDTIGPVGYTELQSEDDILFPPGRQNYWKSSFIHELSDAAIDTMIAHFERVPSSLSSILLEQMGGAVSRVSADATAFSARSAPFSLVITAEWTDPSDADRNIQWTRSLWEAMHPHESDVAYVNYLGADEQDRVRTAYGKTYERLAALKKQYDPTNLFRLNANISPAG